MNWYRLAQRNWIHFPRQRTFPFVNEPGLSHRAEPFLDKSMISQEMEEDTDFNLYHVTTNLSGVISSGGLKSRKQLGTVGLGGGLNNEAPDMVSTTFDYNRAVEIYNMLKYVSEIVHGKIPSYDILNYAENLSYWGFDDPNINGVLENFLPYSVYKKFINGELPEIELEKYISTPRQKYEFFQQLEEAIAKDELSSEDTYSSSIIGFTGSFEDMLRINPNQIAILQLAVRKNAPSEHVPYEKELRFRPEDVRVVRYFQP